MFQCKKKVNRSTNIEQILSIFHPQRASPDRKIVESLGNFDSLTQLIDSDVTLGSRLVGVTSSQLRASALSQPIKPLIQPIQPKRVDDKYSEKAIDDESMELPGKPDDQSRSLPKGSEKKLFNGRIGYNSYPNEVSAKKVRISAALQT